MTGVIDKRRGWAVLVATAAAAGALLLAWPADDAGALAQCPPRHFCAYENTNLTGKQVKMGPERGLTNELAEKMNNKASSVHNARGKAVILYAGKNGKGDAICIDPSETKTNFAEDSFDNLASSAKLTRRESCAIG